MISRVAEDCFWLFRQMERADTLARLLRIHSGMLMEAALPSTRTWRPLLIVLGEEERFPRLLDARSMDDGEAVMEYLTWNPDCPISVVSSIRMAREGARTIRETVSLEMWDALNGTWLWLKDGRGRRLYNRERAAFYEEVGNRCNLFHGACQNTMLHDEPFDFMRLGLNLERAIQTARVLDLQHHALGPTGPGEGVVHTTEWIAILRACAAYEPFFKRSTSPLAGPAVARFLLLDPTFPHSVHHVLLRASNFLERIRRRGGWTPESGDPRGDASWRLLHSVLVELQDLASEDALDGALARGIHSTLTRIVDGTEVVCRAVGSDYFSLETPTPSPSDPPPPSQPSAGPPPTPEA